jgi:prepilin-type N-terminal cleavage/methylation domain-containing protein
MSSKNKAFTLIELLAVILILGIIALIAIPMVLNVIKDAKKGALKETPPKKLFLMMKKKYILFKMENSKIMT